MRAGFRPRRAWSRGASTPGRRPTATCWAGSTSGRAGSPRRSTTTGSCGRGRCASAISTSSAGSAAGAGCAAGRPGAATDAGRPRLRSTCSVVGGGAAGIAAGRGRRRGGSGGRDGRGGRGARRTGHPASGCWTGATAVGWYDGVVTAVDDETLWSSPGRRRSSPPPGRTSGCRRSAASIAPASWAPGLVHRPRRAPRAARRAAVLVGDPAGSRDRGGAASTRRAPDRSGRSRPRRSTHPRTARVSGRDDRPRWTRAPRPRRPGRDRRPDPEPRPRPRGRGGGRATATASARRSSTRTAGPRCRGCRSSGSAAGAGDALERACTLHAAYGRMVCFCEDVRAEETRAQVAAGSATRSWSSGGRRADRAVPGQVPPGVRLPMAAAGVPTMTSRPPGHRSDRCASVTSSAPPRRPSRGAPSDDVPATPTSSSSVRHRRARRRPRAGRPWGRRGRGR